MNPFEQHGITHLSASSLNAFRSSQAYWIISYLAKIKDPANVAMLAGQAAEDAVSLGLFNPTLPIEQCIDQAAKAFREKTALGGFDPEEREGKLEDIIGREAEGRKKAFDGFVRNALTALRPYGTPTKPENNERQHRIEIMLEGIPVPVIGYKDFAFDGHGLDVDLKTTSRMPEDMSQEHQLQAAIYWKASGNRAQRFCYVTKEVHSAVKVIGRQTGAHPRAIRNWYEGVNAPNFNHLVTLAKHTPVVIETFLVLTGHKTVWEFYRQHGNGHDYSMKVRKISSKDAIYSDRLVTINVAVTIETAAELNQRQLWFLGCLQGGQKPKVDAIALTWDVTLRTAKRDVAGLMGKKLIKFLGSKKIGYYELT